MFLWQRHGIHVCPLPLRLSLVSHVSIQGRCEQVGPSVTPSGRSSSSNIDAVLMRPCRTVRCHIFMEWTKLNTSKERATHFDCVANSSVHFTASLNSPPSWDISCSSMVLNKSMSEEEPDSPMSSSGEVPEDVAMSLSALWVWVGNTIEDWADEQVKSTTTYTWESSSVIQDPLASPALQL
jgi:hypothetical protein